MVNSFGWALEHDNRHPQPRGHHLMPVTIRVIDISEKRVDEMPKPSTGMRECP